MWVLIFVWVYLKERIHWFYKPGPINLQWEEHCFDHWEDPHDSFLKPRIVPSKGMIHVGIQRTFNFPPNYSQVNSNHPFPATVQYIPNYCIVIVIPWTRLLLPLLLNAFSICRAKETTFDFAKDVFTDVAKLFPARLVPWGVERTLFSLERKKKIGEEWKSGWILFTWWFFSGLCHEKSPLNHHLGE